MQIHARRPVLWRPTSGFWGVRIKYRGTDAGINQSGLGGYIALVFSYRDNAMSQLNQIQIQHDPRQDRLRLRINTTDKAEFNFWLTRRFVKMLWPVLMQLLESNQQVKMQSGIQAKKAVLSFQHEQAVHEADFVTQYKEDVYARPLGDEPILISRLQVKQQPDGTPVLCFTPDTGQGVDLALKQKILHSFCRLLSETVSQSGWDIKLPVIDNHESVVSPDVIN